MRVLALLNVMILKRVSEIIFLQSNKFAACKVKDKKDDKFFDIVQSSENYPSI